MGPPPPPPTPAGGSGSTQGGTGGSAWSADASWAPLPWAPKGCEGANYALEPAKAAPTLRWIPCENGNPGCTRLVTDWERSVPQRPRFAPNRFHLEPSGSEPFLWSARVQTDEDLEVVYRDSDPILVIRSGDLYCNPGFTQPTAKGACTVFPQPEGNHVALIDWDDPTKAPPLFESSAMFSRGCSAESRLASPGGSPNLYMLSLVTGVETWLRWDDGLFMSAYMTDNLALIVRGVDMMPGQEVAVQDAWYWMASVGLKRFPIESNVWALTFDGSEIAWLEVEAEGVNTLPEGKPAVLWASTAPWLGDWSPRRVADVPPPVFGLNAQRSGKGIFASIEDEPGTFDRRVHVYRLSDGQHWALPNLPDLVRTDDADKTTVPTNIVRVTDTEVWWLGMSESVKQVTTVVRQRLDTL